MFGAQKRKSVSWQFAIEGIQSTVFVDCTVLYQVQTRKCSTKKHPIRSEGNWVAFSVKYLVPVYIELAPLPAGLPPFPSSFSTWVVSKDNKIAPFYGPQLRQRPPHAHVAAAAGGGGKASKASQPPETTFLKGAALSLHCKQCLYARFKGVEGIG